jgi:hypothetical protein
MTQKTPVYDLLLIVNLQYILKLEDGPLPEASQLTQYHVKWVSHLFNFVHYLFIELVMKFCPGFRLII